MTPWQHATVTAAAVCVWHLYFVMQGHVCRAAVCSPTCRDSVADFSFYGIPAGLLSGEDNEIAHYLCWFSALAGLHPCFLAVRESGLALQSALGSVVCIGLASYHALGPCLSASWIPANVGGLSMSTVRLSCLAQRLVSPSIRKLSNSETYSM